MLHRKGWYRKGPGGSRGSKQAQKQLPMYNHHILTGCSSSDFKEVILCNCGHLTALLSFQATQSRETFWKKPSPKLNIHHLFQPWRYWRKWEENFSYPSVVSTLLTLLLTRIRWENTSLHKKKLQLSIVQEAVCLSAGKGEEFYRILKVQHIPSTNYHLSLRKTLPWHQGKGSAWFWCNCIVRERRHLAVSHGWFPWGR